jgi:hypothetical protein
MFKKKYDFFFQIGGGGAPVGAGTSLDPERVIDPKHVSSITRPAGRFNI